MRGCRLLITLVVVVAAAGCGDGPSPPDLPQTPAPVVNVAPGPSVPPPLVFVAQELPFTFQRGATGAAWPVEVTGGGVALRDFDGDGDLDLFFAQGGPLGTAENSSADVLLRNDGNRTFVDVSAVWGLTPKGYGQGVTAADYDADGDTDVYVTRYGPNTLWRNDGGRFVDATVEAGVGDPLWSLGAAFLDADGDGDLDLFVANYFEFDESAAPFARTRDGTPAYGTPATFAGQPDRLYRNEGDGRFVDITNEAGLGGETGRGMGVLAADLDGDRLIDILVASDAEPNALWRNLGGGRFENIAATVGIDLNAEGQSEANMGIAHGDTDGDALPDILITHFVGEHDTLWRARAIPSGGRFYQDETYAAGLGRTSGPMTGWGVALADFNLDGRLDLIVANGHIRREDNQLYAYENPPILALGLENGRFTEALRNAGPYFQALHMGRGLATGDLDDDGDLDVVVTHHDASAVVLWNESPRSGRWLILDLHGRSPNTDAIGAEASVEAGGRTLVRSIDGGGGYLSSNDRRLHFGLGEVDVIDRLRIRWPSGRMTEATGLAPDRVHHFHEPKP